VKVHASKLIALLMALVLIFGLAACQTKTSPTPTTAAPATTAPATPAPATPSPTPAPKTLVSGYNAFNGKFSPFFAISAYDMDVGTYFTGAQLLEYDRQGAMILNGMNGTDIDYNGTSYHYNTLANCDIVQNADGTVDYNITMRPDVKFSDGTPMTIDDAIFSFYVESDTSYDGPASFASLPIVGMQEYRSGVNSDILTKYTDMGNAMFAAGPDNKDFTKGWTQDQQTAFWTTYFDQAGEKMVGQIIADVQAGDNIFDASVVNNNDVALAMASWGYAKLNDDQSDLATPGTLEAPSGATWDLANGQFPTVQDFWNEIKTNYGGAVLTDDGSGLTMDVEAINDTMQPLMVNAWVVGEGPKDPASGGAVNNIAGIKRTGDYTMTITTSSFDATVIYQLGIVVAPLHYYGDTAQYDYANNKFGFPKGDVSSIHAKDAKPLGAGPYVFQSYQSGIVTLQANPTYFKSAPKTTYIRLQEAQPADFIAGMTSGSFDVVVPNYNQSDIDAIKAANSNGELTGDVLTTYAVDNLGYGYIGINANKVNVGGDGGSDASKDLRRAFATMFAVYRETVVNSYYGDRASVINYSISNTSWAAPKPSDEGYSVAFSVDVDGKPIFTDNMAEADKEAAALQAAIGFLKAAGYTFNDASGKFTKAPAGAAMSYEIQIPAGGTGNHPDYGILTAARDALATIGIDLQITDLADATSMFNAMNAGTIEMWAAAWGATPDPDMYQVYHSNNIPGKGGTNSNSYSLDDPKLDDLIMQARQSTDQSARKAMYFQALNIIRDWAVEIPIYQRQNAYVVSTERVNIPSVPTLTTFYTWPQVCESIEMN